MEELNAILDRAVELKEMMKAPDRIDKIAKYVADALPRERRADGVQGIRGGGRPGSVRALQGSSRQVSPADYSRRGLLAVPRRQGGTQELSTSARTRRRKSARTSSARRRQPKILIVTEKLLTGFDAPILYCMYLDKPMRDHVLLQAIARVNRPYEDDDGQVKPYGFVLDFVGIFEKLEKALAFDSDVVASVIQNIDVLKQLFAAMIKEQAPNTCHSRRAGMTRPKSGPSRTSRTRSARGEFLQVLPPATEPLRRPLPGRLLAPAHG